jgi:glycine/serine hydroxymethyltransferase
MGRVVQLRRNRSRQPARNAVTHFPLRADNPYRCDVDRLAAVIDKARPELVIFGKSMF